MVKELNRQTLNRESEKTDIHMARNFNKATLKEEHQEWEEEVGNN